MHKYKRQAMKLTPANQAAFPGKLQAKAPAQVRIVILALVSFLLGVSATALWFHLAAKRIAPVPNTQTGEPSALQSSAPVSGPNSPARAFVEPPLPVAPAAIEDVKRSLPNYASLSVDEGTEILRQAALKKFADAASELQSQVARAQEELRQAGGKSPADQQAAMKQLQQVQAEQSRKLQQIAGQLQTQIAALKQLKSAN